MLPDPTPSHVPGRRCNGCQRDLPAEKFHRNRREKSGLSNSCKECVQRSRARRKAARRFQPETLPEGSRRCRKCGKLKPEESFSLSRKYGRQWHCKTCSRIANKEWVDANREYCNQRQRQRLAEKANEETRAKAAAYARNRYADPNGKTRLRSIAYRRSPWSKLLQGARLLRLRIETQPDGPKREELRRRLAVIEADVASLRAQRESLRKIQRQTRLKGD